MDVGEVVKSEAAPDRRFEDRLRKAQRGPRYPEGSLANQR
jgi:hypothetical protein